VGEECPAGASLRVLLDTVNAVGDEIESHRSELLGPCGIGGGCFD
jgi:hypothetical protein